MSQITVSPNRKGNAYNLFIIALTIFSLIIMVAMFLPLSAETIGLLQIYDSLICIIFLLDFFGNLLRAPVKSDYFIKQAGWLDLLGSIPLFRLTTQYIGILRLARLNRAIRIAHAMRGTHKGEILRDVLVNRSKYAGFITILLAIILLSTASVFVLQFESVSPEANIVTGWDALWYSIVTITTVGYGDFYPVTIWGRITAMFIMFSGVGIIGVLASLMSSLLMDSSSNMANEEVPETTQSRRDDQDLATIKEELLAQRKLLEKISMELEKLQSNKGEDTEN